MREPCSWSSFLAVASPMPGSTVSILRAVVSSRVRPRILGGGQQAAVVGSQGQTVEASQTTGYLFGTGQAHGRMEPRQTGQPGASRPGRPRSIADSVRLR